MAQTFKHTLAFALLFLFSFISPSLTECNIPSDFWCDNADIAKQCGVFEQCQKWLTSTPGDAPVVQVALYYESLCFYCKETIANQLKPAFEKVHDIMNLTLVPYGNAKEEKHGDKWIFICQHGEQECLGNLIEIDTDAIQHQARADLIALVCKTYTGTPKPAACTKE